MKNFWLIILFFALSGTTVFAQTLSGESKTQNNDNSDTEKVDRLFAQWNKPDSPGCSLAVIKDGKIVYKQGYGTADLEHEIPISPQTIFHAGSIAKQFTALAVTMLVQKGKLSLDDDIRKFLPEMPNYKTPITVRQLLWHTSGLREQQDLLWLAGWRREDLQTESDILALVARQKELNFNPGEEFSYSNTNYNLLSVIVSRVTGQNFADYVKANIFAPLGMNHTLVKSDFALIIKNRAIAYLPRQEGGFANSTFSYEFSGSTNLNTTVEDMALWDQNFYSKAVSGSKALEQMLVPGSLNDGTKTGYGFGINIGSYKGLKTIGHGGADPGYLADWIQFPEQRFSVVCLCNNFRLNPAALTRQIADIYLADKFVQSSGTTNNSAAAATVQRVQMSDQQLAKVTGLYLNTVDGTTLRRLLVKDGKLIYSRAVGNESELIPIGESRFRLVTNSSKIEVVIKPEQAKQRRQMLLIVDDQKPIVYESVSEASYSPKQLNEFAGNYYSDELDTAYKIVADGEKLIVKTNKTDFIPPLVSRFANGFADEAGFGVTVKFVRDKSNRVTGFLINRGRIKKLRFSKLSK